jgi:hypothetical protein
MASFALVEMLADIEPPVTPNIVHNDGLFSIHDLIEFELAYTHFSISL